jgi:hypothetical protein
MNEQILMRRERKTGKVCKHKSSLGPVVKNKIIGDAPCDRLGLL